MKDCRYYLLIDDECGCKNLILTNANIEQIENAEDRARYDEDPENVRDILGYVGAIEHYIKNMGCKIKEIDFDEIRL